MSTCTCNVALSRQGHTKGCADTHTCYVWFNPKRHIDPNGRVFVSPAALFDVNVPVNYLSVCSLCLLLMLSEGINQKSEAHRESRQEDLSRGVLFTTLTSRPCYIHISVLCNQTTATSHRNRHTHSHCASWWLKKLKGFYCYCLWLLFPHTWSFWGHNNSIVWLWIMIMSIDYVEIYFLLSFINAICSTNDSWLTVRGRDH